MTETHTTTAGAKAVTSTLASIKQRYETHFHQFVSHAQLAFAAATAHFKQIEDNVESEVSAIPCSLTTDFAVLSDLHTDIERNAWRGPPPLEAVKQRCQAVNDAAASIAEVAKFAAARAQ
jgi:hypothetical protein